MIVDTACAAGVDLDFTFLGRYTGMNVKFIPAMGGV